MSNKSFSRTLSSFDDYYEALFMVDERLKAGIPVVTLILHLKKGSLYNNVSLWQLELTPDAVKTHLEDQVGIFDVPMKESLILKALDGQARLDSSRIQTWTELPTTLSLTLTYNLGTARLEGDLPLQLLENSLNSEIFHMMMTLHKSTAFSSSLNKIDSSLGDFSKDSSLQFCGESSHEKDIAIHTFTQEAPASSAAPAKKRKVVGGIKIFAGSRAKK